MNLTVQNDSALQFVISWKFHHVNQHYQKRAQKSHPVYWNWLQLNKPARSKEKSMQIPSQVTTKNWHEYITGISTILIPLYLIYSSSWIIQVSGFFETEFSSSHKQQAKKLSGS